jgi:hypothetical protein
MSRLRAIYSPEFLSEFQPHIANPSNKDTVAWKMLEPLEDRDFETGSVYIFNRDSSPGHVKIGWTANSVEARLMGWSECGYTPNELFRANDIPFAQRAETLTHHELIKEWRRERQCKGLKCRARQVSHQEWFEVSQERAIHVLSNWVQFFKKAKPYDNHQGTLKPEWEEVVNTMDAEGEIVTATRMLEEYKASIEQKTGTSWHTGSGAFIGTPLSGSSSVSARKVPADARPLFTQPLSQGNIDYKAIRALDRNSSNLGRDPPSPLFSRDPRSATVKPSSFGGSLLANQAAPTTKVVTANETPVARPRALKPSPTFKPDTPVQQQPFFEANLSPNSKTFFDSTASAEDSLSGTKKTFTQGTTLLPIGTTPTTPPNSGSKATSPGPKPSFGIETASETTVNFKPPSKSESSSGSLLQTLGETSTSTEKFTFTFDPPSTDKPTPSLATAPKNPIATPPCSNTDRTSPKTPSTFDFGPRVEFPGSKPFSEPQTKLGKQTPIQEKAPEEQQIQSPSAIDDNKVLPENIPLPPSPVFHAAETLAGLQLEDEPNSKPEATTMESCDESSKTAAKPGTSDFEHLTPSHEEPSAKVDDKVDVEKEADHSVVCFYEGDTQTPLVSQMETLKIVEKVTVVPESVIVESDL